MSERSRQYSVSVTLGEGSGDTSTVTDPIPARSMQLAGEYESDVNKTPGEYNYFYLLIHIKAGNTRKLEIFEHQTNKFE